MDRHVQKHGFRKLTSWSAEPAVDHDLQIWDVCGCRCWRQQRSTRYPGAMLCWHLYTWMHSRNRIRSVTSSQC